MINNADLHTWHTLSAVLSFFFLGKETASGGSGGFLARVYSLDGARILFVKRDEACFAADDSCSSIIWPRELKTRSRDITFSEFECEIWKWKNCSSWVFLFVIWIFTFRLHWLQRKFWGNLPCRQCGEFSMSFFVFLRCCDDESGLVGVMNALLIPTYDDSNNLVDVFHDAMTL